MGEYHPTLDEKGRVAIPMKLRRAFGEDSVINRLVITHGSDKCIMAFREEDWRDFVKNRLITLPQSDPSNRMKMRVLLGGATECELDRQGRITIPSYLLAYAEIKRDVVILGLYDKIEIWSGEIYGEYKPGGESLNVLAGDLGL